MAKFGTGSTSKLLIWILLGLLIIGLAGFGIGGFGGTVRSVGSVGDAEIDINDYARAFSQELEAVRAQRQERISVSDAVAQGLDTVVLRRMIGEAALNSEAQRIGLSVGDEQVRQQILEIPSFRNSDGEFDREAYEFALRQNGLTVAGFESDIREETARALLQGAVAGALPAPSAYAETLVGFVGETRDFTWVRLGRGDLDEPLEEPTDEQLRAHLEAEADAFTIPESKRLTYVSLSPDMLVDEIEVDEAALRALYQDRITEFARPERRLVERLVFQDEASATAAMERIEAGEASFEDMVAERGLELADVDLGDVTEADLGAAGEAVFALEEPGLAGPAMTDLGPAIFRVNAILAAEETPFEVARPSLQAEYATDQARRLIADRIEAIDDLLAGGATLEDLANETDLTLDTIDWYPQLNEGIAAYPAFRRAAASVSEDDFPEVIQLEDGGIFALRFEETVPARLRDFDEIREELIASWQSQETETRLRVQAETIVGRLQEGMQWEGIGKRMNVETGLARDDALTGSPPEFMEQVFDMEVGEIRVIDGFGAVYIVRLDGITPPDPQANETQALVSAVSAQARQTMSQDALEYLGRAIILREGGPQLNQAALDAVHAQMQ